MRNKHWCLLGMLAVLLTAAGPARAADAIMDRIRADLNSKFFEIYETTYGQPAQTNLVVGKEYLLAIKTSELESLKNVFAFKSKDIYETEFARQIVRFRVDPAAADDSLVNVAGSPDGWRWWKFKLLDDPMLYELKAFRVELIYQRPGNPQLQYAYRYFNLSDTSPETPLVLNLQAPLATETRTAGYFGSLKTDEEMQTMWAMACSTYLKATKGYVALVINNQGRRPFPHDNAFVGNTLHAYTAWWNVLPHDLAGTSLQPLDPADPQNLELIKTAWYADNAHSIQLMHDPIELFGWSSASVYLLLADVPNGIGGGGGTVNFSGFYNNVGFAEQKNGVNQYGLRPDFGLNALPDVMKTLLHEFGHTFNQLHPPGSNWPSDGPWTVQMPQNGFNQDIMRQANTFPYQQLLFYRDETIKKMLEPVALPAGATLMAIPFVEPVGDPLNQAAWVVKGVKEAQAAIYINGVLASPGNTQTAWTATVNLAMGQNQIEISQQKAGKRSHPYVLFVTRVAPEQPLVPSAQLTWHWTPGVATVGAYMTFDLQAQARAGLKVAWWWVEKQGSNGQYQKVGGLGYQHNLYGAAASQVRYHVSFPEPGTYKIRGRSRDLAYPTPGQDHQSPIAELTVNVQ